MILHWLTYSAVTGLLLSAAATLLERPLRERRVPVRWLWVTCLGSLLLLPGARMVAGSDSPGEPIYQFEPAYELPTQPAAVEAEIGSVASAPPASPRAADLAASPELDRWILLVWALSSAALVLFFAAAFTALHSRQRRWRRVRIDGHEALLSPDTGPAVELDCDARVLARGADPRSYARVLLDVSERGSAHRLTVAALSESPSFLERRIRLMIRKPKLLSASGVSALVVAALVIVVAACQVDQPASQPIVATGFSLAPTEAVVPDTQVAAEEEIVGSPTPQRLPALTEAALSDSIEVTFRSILAERHPEVIEGRIRGDRVNLYVSLSGNGDVIASAVDTQPRSGSCSRVLEEGLGITLDRATRASGGCGGLDAGEAGPSPISFYWSAEKPETAQERVAPTGRYLVSRLLEASRPTPEQLAEAVREYFPEVYEDGLPQGESLWFVADRYHRVVHAGRGWEQASSPAARAAIERELPGVALEGGLMTAIRSDANTPVGIFWARLGEGPPERPVERPRPYPHAQTFAVSTSEPGRRVEIRLEGEAAADPSALRISGKFTNDDGVLTATTPFTLIVLSPAPYRATLQLQGDGEMQLETESEARRLRTRGGAVYLSRGREAEPAQIRGEAGVTARPPGGGGLPSAGPVAR